MIVDTINELNQQLKKSWSLSFRQQIKKKQLILMSDASFKSTGYVIMIEDDPNQKLRSRIKTYCPLGRNHLIQHNLKCRYTQTSSFQFILHFLNLDILCVFPVIVFRDNSSVTRFFQTEITPPPLWNACDYVIQYSFVKGHAAGTMNKAIDFLSRAEVNRLKNSE